MVDYKSLAKLAKACRKAGIKHFKNAEFEFTLTEESPQEYTTRAVEQPPLSGNPLLDGAIEKELTEEELLLWSAVDEHGQIPSYEGQE